MKHYGVYNKVNLKDSVIKEDIVKQLEGASAVFLVLDISQFEISSSAIDWIVNLDKPIFLIVNKCDLLDDWISKKDITRWVSERLSVRRDLIFPLSAKDKKDMKSLRERIEDTFSPSERVLLLGTTNVGKSTILSALTKNSTPTISRLPGTTVGITEVKGEHLTYIDVPGLKEINPWLKRLCSKCLVNLIPRKTFKNLFSVVKEGQVLMIGAIAWLTVREAGERGWVKIETFTPDEFNIHKSKEDRVDDLTQNHIGDILNPPCQDCWDTLNDDGYETHPVSMYVNQDLVIPGCGWFTLRSGHFKGEITLPKGINPVIRPMLITSESERKKKGKKR